MRQSKGQMMLITAVIVSVMMIGVGSAVSQIAEREFTQMHTGYTIEMVNQTAVSIDTTFRKNRENFRKMLGFLGRYRSNVVYSQTRACFNVTMTGENSRIVLNCIG